MLKNLTKFIDKKSDPIFPVIVTNQIRRKKLPVKITAFEAGACLRLFTSFPEQEKVLPKAGQISEILEALKKYLIQIT